MTSCAAGFYRQRRSGCKCGKSAQDSRARDKSVSTKRRRLPCYLAVAAPHPGVCMENGVRLDHGVSHITATHGPTSCLSSCPRRGRLGLVLQRTKRRSLLRSAMRTYRLRQA